MTSPCLVSKLIVSGNFLLSGSEPKATSYYLAPALPTELLLTQLFFLQIAQYFSKAEDKSQLRLLGIKSIGAAVKAFIDKEDKDAVNVIVENQVWNCKW